jgi:hypothetical protein
METLSAGRWEVNVDQSATRTVNSQRKNGEAEKCGCLYCRNYAAARKHIPAEAIDLLDKLGIDPKLESHVSHCAEMGNRLHLYTGFFHFVGSLVAGADVKSRVKDGVKEFTFEPLSERFSFGFTADTQLLPDSFGGMQCVQLEFAVELPWVLEEPPEENA